MPPRKSKTKSKIEIARQYLASGTIAREDSDDELGVEDLPWEWIYEDGDEGEDGDAEEENQLQPKDVEEEIVPLKRKPGRPKKVKPQPQPQPASVKEAAKKRKQKRRIAGARMGSFECRVGDTVLLKAESNEAWVGIVCAFFEAEEEAEGEREKLANFMWFSTTREIRNKGKKRGDALENELYISPSWDDNPLASINGRAVVMSPDAFAEKYPSGKVPRNSRDYGKVFLCRRGCNTRTATYTEEFVWEDVYRDYDDIDSLIDLVKSQTKATRKRKANTKEEKDLDDFVEGEEDEDGAPQTPKKRRKLNASTPSKKNDLTPRKFLTPTHKRIVVKKPLEFTPLGTRILPPEVLASPHALARTHLHVSSVPATLPCRESEFSEVYTQLESAITSGTGSCIYIAGVPGTGKTATVREVIAQLNASVLADELDDFIFVEINGMKVTDPHQSYSLLWEALRGDRVSPSHALDLLTREFSSPSPRRVPCVVLMDELDQLVTKNQSVMYNFFNWPQLRHSRLIVLAVANTMDLPERTLSNKISSRLGLYRITFKGYTHDQLMQIIKSRLANVPGDLVHPDAVQFASRKVAAVSGDARRALDICRRAVEIAEADALAAENEADPLNNHNQVSTPSKTGRGKPATTLATAPAKRKSGIVTIATIKLAIAEATSSPLQLALRALPLASKIFLSALLARIRRTGLGEAVLGDVLDEARRIALMCQIPAVESYLLAAGADEGGGDEGYVSGTGVGGIGDRNSTALTVTGEKVPARRGAPAKSRAGVHVARLRGLGQAAVELMEAGIVGLEARRGERVGRVRLAVGDEEVRLALKDDAEVKGLGFGAA
ncbi:P-loop containing nucleoside triphosphate hydrolase protein [Aulographum hederae CBS 113979]|uniref:Origin recognition complex subunit 1 n=1 Tax=Aulographum hederae CBS 113979 TaxID=1176131 RepID=A0A6G1H8T5_9PEZI|nr:P-loop containing nucleoside triphosphate hydrolase protein [Aulographum hederae CBS 113979]